MKKQAVEKPKRVLCYLDFSKNSYYLVDYAYQLSRLIDAELFVLHTVTDIKRAAGFYVPHINTDKLEEEVIKAAKDKLYGICSQVLGDKIDSSHRLIMRGSPLEVINEVIEDKKIELLILTHELGKGTLSGFRSDYAEKFMKQATIPFLVLPFN
ncbi:MAG TPA: universal stress protein [Deltaproteobacteria bacterium]|jgi:nucleotide-binding universal stress UspA family protein|nr:universal stress protein [Deltaproteobacteria bacterium]HPJ94188.1 universal stress protein [Deltaproteobacteria bacterium]HPR51878.1 universal stress protein [Deltaproteobacteria bacterium]